MLKGKANKIGDPIPEDFIIEILFFFLKEADRIK
jgi:hypothetical protein